MILSDYDPVTIDSTQTGFLIAIRSSDVAVQCFLGYKLDPNVAGL